jgi:hypothetical protein
MPTFLVKLAVQNLTEYRQVNPDMGPTRTIEQKFGGCKDEDEAKTKALSVFPKSKIKSVKLVKEKK